MKMLPGLQQKHTVHHCYVNYNLQKKVIYFFFLVLFALHVSVYDLLCMEAFKTGTPDKEWKKIIIICMVRGQTTFSAF